MDLTTGITKAEQERITIQGRGFGEYVKNSEIIESKTKIFSNVFKIEQLKNLIYAKEC